MSADPCILLVEDDERFRERLATALRARGLAVSVAENSQNACRLLEERNYSGVVTDLKMPGGSGLQVVEKARATSQDLRIVVLTGYGSIATAVEAMRLGANNYLVKPCTVDQIRSALEADDAPDEAALRHQTPSLARLEREHIERVLVECEGNVSKAARVLGINRRTLQYKLAKYPVER